MSDSRAFEKIAFSCPRESDTVDQSRLEPRKYKYSTLMQVEFFNTYYNQSEEKCADFTIYPTTSTQTLMKSLGLLFKKRRTGFSILYNTKAEHTLVQYLRNHGTRTDSGDIGFWSKLSFIAALRNPVFVNFTDLPFNVDLTTRNIYLSNQMAHREDNEILLNEGNYISSRQDNFTEVVPSKFSVPFEFEVNGEPVSTNKIVVKNLSGEEVICESRKPAVSTVYLDFVPFPEGLYTIVWLDGDMVIFEKQVIYTASYPTPLCFIDLLFSRPTEDATGIYPVNLALQKNPVTATQYNLRFRAREIHWVYWVVPSAQPVENMRIRSDGDNPVTFRGPTPGSIPTGRPAWRFVSHQVIPMRERSPLRFRLVDRLNCRCENPCECPSKTLVNPLPLMSSNQVLRNSHLFPPDIAPPSKTDKYSEVYVYV